jgi:rhamnose utilization protein RhaD (predicted bifunctional aldolase and dehydrogenase)
MENEILNQLITMSNNLGNPINDYVILGEGNTSSRVDDETFWVKASGTQLNGIDQSGFVQVRFDRVLPLLNDTELSDTDITNRLNAAKVDQTQTRHPSVETFLHALTLQLDGINFVGHTHPTAINSLTCSVGFEQAVSGRLFPDEIVLCGPAPVSIPYTDPGLALARKMRDQINEFIETYKEIPRVIFMQNHGLIVLGRTAQQVENITAMTVKTARILLGAYAAGGPNLLSQENVNRIHTRPDEHYRRKLLEK